MHTVKYLTGSLTSTSINLLPIGFVVGHILVLTQVPLLLPPLECLVQVPCTGSSCTFREDPYDPLIHDLRLQHFYNTRNIAAARLLF